MGWLNWLLRRQTQKDKETQAIQNKLKSNLDISQREAYLQKLKLSPNLEENIRLITELFGNSADLIVRPFLSGTEQIPGVLLCFEGMFNKDSVENILRILEIDTQKLPGKLPRGKPFLDTVKNHLLSIHSLREVSSVEEICREIAYGRAALLFAGVNTALLCETSDWETRAVTEPAVETSIRGGREGFVENITTNISLLRRRLKTPSLWSEEFKLGKLSQTKLMLTYIKGLASEDVLTEIRSRLGRIKTDAILESGHVEEYIEDTPFTLFPLVFRTERPDRVVSALLEGRVAIFTDGTPFVLVVPTQFFSMLQAPDDYYERAPIGSLIRTLRYFSYLLAMLLPGIYVAVVNFHQGLLPTTLLLRITATREGVPFPVVVETLIMEAAFEVLREAGIRLPRYIGFTISIVGALILGEAAIKAGIVSPVVIIVMSMTAISSFTVPVFSIGVSARIIRFAFIFLGGTLGLFGVQYGIMLLLIHLCSLRSFGTPYFAPLGPLILSDWKDSFIRIWWWGMTIRPKLLGFREPQKAKSGQIPGLRQRKEDDS